MCVGCLLREFGINSKPILLKKLKVKLRNSYGSPTENIKKKIPRFSLACMGFSGNLSLFIKINCSL